MSITIFASLKSLVGLDGLEPSTSRLSGARSSHLSYKPLFTHGLYGSSTCASLSVFAFQWKVKSEEWRGEIPFGNFWWRWWGSNPWPPACRAGALPAELHPRLGFGRINQWSPKIEQQDLNDASTELLVKWFCLFPNMEASLRNLPDSP